MKHPGLQVATWDLTGHIHKLQQGDAVLTARLSSGGALLFSASYIRMDSSRA